MTTWIYNKKKIKTLDDMPKDIIGFVYIITNLTNDKKYIGKKLISFKKVRKPLKGKKNKRRSMVESDWLDYWGSSNDLKYDIEMLGKDKFGREIIYWCTTKAQLSYLEAKEQFDRGVLLNEHDEYYNKIINCRIGFSKSLMESLKSKT